MSGSVLAALAVFVIYLLVVGVIWKRLGVNYLSLADSHRSVVRSIVIPIGVGLVVLVIATTILGWWPDVMTQERTGPSWLLVVPVLFGVTALSMLARIDWRSGGRSILPVLAIGTILIGMAEELLSRGVLVVGAQKAGWSLLAVWLFSSVLFGLLHGINGFVGMPWKAVPVQVVLAFMSGTGFFITVFATGSIVVAMALHALWDFGTIGMQATGRTPGKPQMALMFGLPVVCIATIWPLVLN